MTPPKVSDIGPVSEPSEAPPAVSLCVDAMRIETMKNRPDYLRTAQGRRQGTGSFLLQGRARGDDLATVRIGFTASKKIGNAVARNRAQRFETAEELLLALERGASRPLSATGPQPLMQRDATALWKIALAVSVLVNVLLIYWLLFLPR